MFWFLALVARAGSPAADSLFERDWSAAEGLGPMFNARSCVGCHSQGGAGGAGDADHDVFALSSGRVIHASSLDDGYEAIRDAMLHPTFDFPEGMCGTGMMRAIQSQTPHRRQTPALFGLHALDLVPESEIERQLQSQGNTFPEVSGRIARDAEGRPGRFGWKAQQASLAEATRNAAANELGLVSEELPPDLFAKLILEVQGFLPPAHAPNAAGRAVFESVGCASCHAVRIGSVEGAFTDLLVHDMGFELAEDGAGYGFAVDAGEQVATANEWRTPPLWGVNLSAPYLHDGRAKSLEEAILAHGGEAEGIRLRYQALTEVDRGQVIGFLASLD